MKLQNIGLGNLRYQVLLIHIHKNNQPNNPPPIMIKGVENHEILTSSKKQAIDDEHYRIKLMNNGITKLVVY
jgi:hypothetical protein